MNLHAVVSGAIAAVNPHQPVTLQFSTGYTTNDDGSRDPTYATPVTSGVIAQVQQLTIRDIRQLEMLNIQGSMRKIWLSGSLAAIVRISAKGGDLVTLQDGSIWLVTAVLEQWPDWVSVAVTLQDERVPDDC